MAKKFFALLTLLAMMSLSFSPVIAQEVDTTSTTTAVESSSVVCTTEYIPVCGTDNKTYSNSCNANGAGVDVSYDGACKSVEETKNQQETKETINFVGVLIEIGSTDLPTTIIVRKNGTSTDYTVNITSTTLLGENRSKQTALSDWVPGDQIRVRGNQNENTGEVDATTVVNHSFDLNKNDGLNGWIVKVDKDTKQITYKWANKDQVFNYDDKTKFVVGGKNPALVDDLKVNDRIRGRLIKSTTSTPTAKMVVVLRRGNDLFMKIRTFVPKVELVRLDSTVVPTTIQVKIKKTPGLKEGDVNNLIGGEGSLVTVNVTENTNIVRKFFGKTTLSELAVGDDLHIVGRVNDDGTVDAKLIKDESIWKTNTQGHAGEVTEVNATGNYLMLNWTPIQQMPSFKLKKVLKGEDKGYEDDSESGEMQAQSLESEKDCEGDSSGQYDCEGSDPKKKNKEKKPVKKDIVKLKIGKETKQIIREIKEFKQEMKSGSKDRLKERSQDKKESEKVGKFTRETKLKKVKIDRIKQPNTSLGKLVKRMPEKKIKVEINSQTKIVIGTNESGTISDIKVGDKIRVRGTRFNDEKIVADTIMVVNSLPEIEEALSTSIDDVNEIVEVSTTTEEIVADTSIDNANTEVEVEIDDAGEVVEVQESVETTPSSDSNTTTETTDTSTGQ